MSRSSQQAASEKTDSETPMLLNNPEVCPPVLNTCKTMGEVSRYALWPIVGMIFHPMYTIINAAVVGRMETQYLAALGLGTLTTGLCLLSICNCFALVIPSFVAPAHGVGDHCLARIYLHRQYLLNTFVFLVAFIPIIFIKQIYAAIGQDEEISTLATQYVWTVGPTVLPYTQSLTMVGYAEAQQYTSVSITTLATSTVVHAIFMYIFVGVMDLGWTGVCLSTMVMFLSRFVITLTYLQFIKPYQESSSIQLFSRQSSTNISDQFKRGLMSLLMGVWGWWAFDIFTLIATYLSTEIVSAQTIMRSLGLLTFMVPVGLGKACQYYCGIFLGRGCEKSITHYYNICLLLSVITGAAQMVLLWACREPIINMYTDNSDVMEQMRLAWNVFVVFAFFDTVQFIGQSAIRASGRQSKGAFITGLAYWGIGIPITCMLVFWQTWGIMGIWIGPTLAVLFNTVAYQIMVKSTNWSELIRESEQGRAKAKVEEAKVEEAKVEEGDDMQTEDGFKKANSLN